MLGFHYPSEGSNDHVHATANGDEEDGDFDEEGIATYLNILHDMTVRPSQGIKINSATNYEFATDRQTRSAARRPYTRPQVSQHTLRTLEACCRKSRGKAPRGKKDDGTGWLHLIEAQQHAYHPMLVQLKLAHRGLMESVAEWCRQLGKGDNSLSRRVEAILDTIQEHLDLRPDDSFIIVDESVWFLDIVAIALKKTYHPVAHDTYNGRLDTVQRHLTIKKVDQAMPLHTLLASRGTGSQGLDMQFANIVIDADLGQQKHTFIHELRAQGCAVEKYAMEIRDKKSRTLDAIDML
ncbi:global transactivator [Fusarium pseudocircinatum]|uniref:Global transactivator n=1 Tax=Fusarium pseudocircinatum TaxID=56676 RepID=A0A8H5PML7_9HYPO|nr:global transactivator [Fusarium pseudocircinatum]